jgi:hypothetical protein
LVPAFVVSGTGMAMFFAPVATIVLGSVRRNEEGIASGATNALRELGGVFGIAVLASVFNARGGYLSGTDFVNGLRPAVYVGAAGVGLAAALLLLAPRRTVQLVDADSAPTVHNVPEASSLVSVTAG